MSLGLEPFSMLKAQVSFLRFLPKPVSSKTNQTNKQKESVQEMFLTYVEKEQFVDSLYSTVVKFPALLNLEAASSIFHVSPNANEITEAFT